MPSEVFQFHYVTAPTGELSGHSFMVQTEDAINAIGRYAYDSTQESTEALRIAKQALSTAETASNNASAAVTTANSALSLARTLQTTVESWGPKIQAAESHHAGGFGMPLEQAADLWRQGGHRGILLQRAEQALLLRSNLRVP